MNINTVQPASTPPMPDTTQVDKDRGAEAAEKLQENNSVQQTKPLEEEPAVEELKELTDNLNEYMDDFQTDLGFFINEELNNEVIVEIKNRKTDELIKQIPSEEIIAIREKMEELTGLLFDKSV